MSDILLVEDRNGIRRLTLNRPDRKNSVSPELREELLAAIETYEQTVIALLS